MKKLIVFGATGGTGKEVVKQALEQGNEITIIIRNPSAFELKHPHLKIITGDVLQLSSFENEVKGKDAVISCLGVGSSTKPTTVYSKGIENIIVAMNKAEVRRLICISAGALYVNKDMGFFVGTITKLVLQRIFKEMYGDMRLMEKKVENSNLDWTVVRPPMLKNKKLTGKYRIAVNSHVKRPSSISRANLAHFILHIVDDAQTLKVKTEISA